MKAAFIHLAKIPAALLYPDRIFDDNRIYRGTVVPLALILFLLFVVGERLVYGYYQNPFTRLLAALEADQRVSRLMAAAPEEAREQVRGRMTDRLLGNRSRYFGAVTITLTGLLFMVLILETWVVMAVLSQFFGGQEERKLGRRPSVYLAFYAFVPLAVRKLIEGVLMTVRDPGLAANALTLDMFRQSSRVSFSLAVFLPQEAAGSLLANLVAFYTDPFLLWCFAILVMGAREVYRIRLRNAFWLAAGCMIVLGAQNHLLRALGLQWGVLL